MIYKRIVSFVLLSLILLIFGSTVPAHELFIEVKEEDEELRIDVLWGHIRDFVDNANIEDYELYVRDPQGNVQPLDVEEVGVQGRAIFRPDEEGEYVFWALRAPGTHNPEDGVTALSVQMAKAVAQFGEGRSTATEPVNMLLEIVPNTGFDEYSTGSFTGTVFQDGAPIGGAVINAYGPGGEVVETESDAEGTFAIEMGHSGVWLIKANLQFEEEGNLKGEIYDRVSQTSTLLIDTQPNARQSDGDGTVTKNSPLTMVALLVIGLLLGGSGTLLMTRKKKG